MDYQFLKGLVFSCRTEAPHEIQVDRPWSFRFNHIKTCIFIAHKKLRAIQLFILMDLSIVLRSVNLIIPWSYSSAARLGCIFTK